VTADETRAGPGERQPLDELFSATYEELRRLASTVRRGESSDTLNPTALVNEAYLKLARSMNLVPATRLHFKRIAARAMRQVLIEAARRRTAQKRGGESAFVTFDEQLETGLENSDQLLALDSALDDLAGMEPRQARMVEYRFFGGFEMTEIAELLDVSESTILRDWRAAKAWLSRELRRAGCCPAEGSGSEHARSPPLGAYSEAVPRRSGTACRSTPRISREGVGGSPG
jgi:RNA polymerase sigma factor (TIGR02999 family)